MATSENNDRSQQNRQPGGSQQGGNQQGGVQQGGVQQGGSQQAGNPRSQESRQSDTSHRGFASMDPDKQREIASEGGRAAHEKGTAHEFTSDEARRAGSQSHKNDTARSERNVERNAGAADQGNAQSGQGGSRQGGPGQAGGTGSRR